MTLPYALLLSAVVGYLLGSIPSGMVVARVYRNVDITAHGSGRTGATNVLRTLGPGAAAVAFAGDFLKGVVAVAIASQLGQGDLWPEFLAAIGAVLGHTYSPFIGFKGGRGVVTGLGATAFAAPLAMLLAVVVGAILIAATRYVSLGSVVGSSVGGLALVALAFWLKDPAWAVWGVAVAGFIVVAHRDNIQRLMAGTERRIGKSA